MQFQMQNVDGTEPQYLKKKRKIARVRGNLRTPPTNLLLYSNIFILPGQKKEKKHIIYTAIGNCVLTV